MTIHRRQMTNGMLFINLLLTDTNLFPFPLLLLLRCTQGNDKRQMMKNGGQ
jgi:hypothetical protein